MTVAGRPRAAGTSVSAITHHYDRSDEFFRLWLGDELVYSCAWWESSEGPDSLARAQDRKLDFFADRLNVGGARVLDVGCGWGAMLDRFIRVHGAASGVGITLSPGQTEFATGRRVPNADFRQQSWVEHVPDEPYDAITCVEATEHFATDRLSADEKVEIYRRFFAQAASWLRPGGRLGLQLICLDNAAPARIHAGAGPFTDLILDDIFRESMSASLSEMVLGWETHFELDEFHEHADHYRRTFRAWALAHRQKADAARALVGDEASRVYRRYFAAGEAIFRLREQSLYRVILTKRPEPKAWAVTVRPSELAPIGDLRGTSVSAVRSHYDVANSFYEQWLGPSMMYSSAMWADEADSAAPPDLEAAHSRKIDFFAARLLPTEGPHRVLDVGCGWGGTLRRLAEVHGVTEAVGLTLSQAQRDYLAEHPVPGAEVRLEDWNDHVPGHPYDAVVSFGAFEHFARDGTTGPQRIATYRRFFRDCREWLAPGGRLGLETIAHDGAPDTDAPLGRGPLGDFVLGLFPESLCPHLGEVVLGFEPYFELEVLRSDADDFAQTFRAWLIALRSRDQEAATIVGDDAVRRFRRYLAASEIQFRTRVLTNYRLVLRRRPDVLS